MTEKLTALTYADLIEKAARAADADDLGRLDEIDAEMIRREAAALGRDDFTETTVGWGEDTNCTECVCCLAAGSTAYINGGERLCVDCAARIKVEAA
jgi:hypothetical protein